MQQIISQTCKRLERQQKRLNDLLWRSYNNLSFVGDEAEKINKCGMRGFGGGEVMSDWAAMWKV